MPSDPDLLGGRSGSLLEQCLPLAWTEGCRGEFDANLPGLWSAESGVEGKGLLPVAENPASTPTAAPSTTGSN
jgi:hypothetical protein